MNKTLKKIIPLMLLSATATMSGCSMYSSKAAEKNLFVGTYELDVYKARHEMNAEEEPYDRKADEGIKAYFSLDINGSGYYGYKDNKTEAWVDSVFSRYIVDDENQELFKAIKMSNGVVDNDVYEWDWKVGCLDEPTMGFQYKEVKKEGIAGVFSKKTMEYTLSYTIPQRHNNIMNKDIRYQYVSYKKISDETGLAPINKALGTSFTLDKPYEIKRASGYYVYRCDSKEGSGIGNKNIYQYAILDMNSYSNGKVNLVYTMGTVGSSMNATILGSSFHTESLGLTINTVFDESKDIKQESFSRYYGDSMTLDEIIAQETAA
jgi:hypothetical protein